MYIGNITYICSMENTENKKGCVYFFRHIGLTPVKIGFSTHESPIGRFEQFKTYAPYGSEIIGFIVFITLHELIHAAFIPNAFHSSKTLWGIIGLGVFIYTTEAISKRRFIMISIMPYIVLSLLFPLVMSILGGLNGYTILLCLINAMGSSVDFLNGYLILVQVPDDALILSNGRETYYRKS